MKKILLLLSEGFEIFEASAFIDVFGWNTIYGSQNTELFTCAKKKNIKSTFNVHIEVDILLDQVEVSDFDALAIPGGFEIFGFYNDAYSPEFSEIIQQFDRQNKPIASICVGALPVGNSGVLKQRNATTYNLLDNERVIQLSNFEAFVIDQPIVADKNIITSCGPFTAIDVAFELLVRLTDKENCKHVRKLMGFNL